MKYKPPRSRSWHPVSWLGWFMACVWLPLAEAQAPVQCETIYGVHDKPQIFAYRLQEALFESLGHLLVGAISCGCPAKFNGIDTHSKPDEKMQYERWSSDYQAVCVLRTASETSTQ